MKKSKVRFNRFWAATFVAAGVLGASAGLIGPAEATQTGVSGDQLVPSTVNWATPRYDSYAQNTDTFQLTGAVRVTP